eukprot:jgi/Ulvmu1/4904/UM020_0190.1
MLPMILMTMFRPLADSTYEVYCIRKQLNICRTLLRHFQTTACESMINQKIEEVMNLCAKLIIPGQLCQFQGICIHIQRLLERIRALHRMKGTESQLGAALSNLDMCVHCCEISCSHAAYMAVCSRCT